MKGSISKKRCDALYGCLFLVVGPPVPQGGPGSLEASSARRWHSRRGDIDKRYLYEK